MIPLNVGKYFWQFYCVLKISKIADIRKLGTYWHQPDLGFIKNKFGVHKKSVIMTSYMNKNFEIMTI